MAISIGPEIWIPASALVLASGTPTLLNGIASSVRALFQQRRGYSDLAVVGTTIRLEDNEAGADFKLAYSGESHLIIESIEIMSRLKPAGIRPRIGGWITLAIARSVRDQNSVVGILSAESSLSPNLGLFGRLRNLLIPLSPRLFVPFSRLRHGRPPSRLKRLLPLRLNNYFDRLENWLMFVISFSLFIHPLFLSVMLIKSPFPPIELLKGKCQLKNDETSEVIKTPFLIEPNTERIFLVSQTLSTALSSLVPVEFENVRRPWKWLPPEGEPLVWEVEQFLRIRTRRRRNIVTARLGSFFLVGSGEDKGGLIGESRGF